MVLSESLKNQLVGVAVLCLGGLFIGLAPIGLRFAIADGMTPNSTAFWRYFFSLPLMLAFMVFRQRLPHKPNKWVFLAGLFFALDIGFWHLALTLTSVANATFLVNLGNILVGILAWIFLKNRPGVFWFVAVVLALSGAYLLSAGGAKGSGSGAIEGDLIAVLAAGFVALYMLFTTLARRSLGAVDVLFWATLTELVVAAILCAVLREPILPPSFSALFWPFFLSIFAQIAGQGCIIFGVGRAPPAISGIVVLIQPVTAALISWGLFDEALNSIQISGAGLILGALIIAQMRFRKVKASQS